MARLRARQTEVIKKKASEPEGPEAVIPAISLVALPCGDAETVSGGIRQHQNASSEASSRYSHSLNRKSRLVYFVMRVLGKTDVATLCGTPRYFTGTALLFYLKLKWNLRALSFGFVSARPKPGLFDRIRS